MTRPAIVSGQIYHLFNRGVNRQPIFFNKGNYTFFIGRMRRYFRPTLVEVLAYCLMPTHYHILILPRTDDFGKAVMQPFATSYVKAVNKQQGRVGTLFQGAFKSRLVQRDGDLLHLSRYIHLNPVSAGLVSSPADWRHSSYLDHVGTRHSTFLFKGKLLSYFDSAADFQAFVEDPDEGVS
jgi:REP element-mobilizing transposase RayT